jgi:hypothetical protein
MDWSFTEIEKTWLTDKTHKPKKTLTARETDAKTLFEIITERLGREPTYNAFCGMEDFDPVCPKCGSKNIKDLQGVRCISCGDWGCVDCGTTWQGHVKESGQKE